MASETHQTSHARGVFADRLAHGAMLLDGAMGTLLFSRGVPQRASLDELVLSRPELVGAVHREYIDAGADIIETNTFSANRERLTPLGLGDRTTMINRRAAQLAREARDVSGRSVLVAGSIGPISSPIHGPVRLADARVEAAVSEQVDGLLEGGVDLLMIESANDLGHLLAGIRAARRSSDLPVVASMTFGEELVAVDGSTPEAAAMALRDAAVDALGVNCGGGPISSLEALERMAATAGDLPLLIMPNAGLSSRIGGEFVYAAGPDYFAEEVPRFLAAGSRLLGGCCGTTPAHLAGMRQALDREHARTVGTERAERPPSAPAPATTASAVPRAGTSVDGTSDDSPPPTGLASALAEGRFVISVEIDPPRSVRIERTLESAALIKEAGADLVNISDSAMARVRMGAMAVGFAIQADPGLECLIHFTTRDRNLMALESELLGAHALGIRNILALTGDPPRIGDNPGGSGIWDVDSTGLIGILTRLNRGEDRAGQPIGSAAGFTIACALDPTAQDLEREIDRLSGKIDAGAHLIMTQPIYAPEQWRRFMDAAAARWGDRLPRPVLLGILPLHSSRHAEFLHNEVPGITIPDVVRDGMRAAGERGAEVGLEASLELLAEMMPFVEGTYIMPSFGRYEQSAELVKRIRAGFAPAPAGDGAVA